MDLKAKLLEVIAKDCMSFAEISREVGAKDRRVVRLALAQLVREGIVRRVPDYERRSVVFCTGEKG